ncbi:hypothetical protein H5410_061428 [Solanum commersonii]|uniref:Uncharacterized protein n=1 Tax=Solanum commersonii TaxID=4109 RepID=A0A9J5W9M2_SOLCO|nr:hypothetical protein H5410_061428 [Solanum commersonii]
MCPKGQEIINIAGYICHQIFRDLILLENQLPFFVLNKLHDMTIQGDELPLLLLANVSFIFFVDLPNMIRASFDETECNTENIKHLLHTVHILSCHGQKPKKRSKYDIKRQKAMPNATELSQAEVSFLKVGYYYKEHNRRGNTSLFDIKFEKGVIIIPYFEVFDYTETFLRNLIAYEQQSSDVLTYFSDYVTFMDHLIDSEKDVNLLRQKGIIENWMGEDKEVACLFNKIGNGVGVYSNFYYSEEFKEAVDHCEKPLNRAMANLIHNYFSSPWAGASTVTAIILFLLTTIQTILAFTGGVKYLWQN